MSRLVRSSWRCLPRVESHLSALETSQKALCAASRSNLIILFTQAWCVITTQHLWKHCARCTLRLIIFSQYESKAYGANMQPHDVPRVIGRRWGEARALKDVFASHESRCASHESAPAFRRPWGRRAPPAWLATFIYNSTDNQRRRVVKPPPTLAQGEIKRGGYVTQLR